MKLIRKKLTYANVMSTIAVFLVLGGGAALAATHLAKNSVGAKQLKKNAVTTAKVKNGAINGAKVADGSLTGTDVADGSIGTSDLADLAVNANKLAADSVDSGKVKDKSLKGNDVADDSLTGTQIDEGTLKGVDAATLSGKSSTQFLSSDVYKNESGVEAGQTLGDETQVLGAACNPGDVLLSGGPANIAKTTTLLESFPSPGSTSSWTVRVNKNGQTDNFSVVVLCVKQ